MSQAETTGLSVEDRDKIEEISRKFMERMVSGDMAGVAQLYTSDAVLIPPNHPNVSGQSAIADFLGTFPKITRFTLANDEVDGRDDIAYARGRYEMTLEPEGEAAMDDQGSYVEVRKRQSDGSWPIAVDMFSSNLEA